MKVALTCPATIFPAEYGGSEKTVGYRAMELDKMGHEVHLYSAGPYKPANGKLIIWSGNVGDVHTGEYDIIDNNCQSEFSCHNQINTVQGPFYPKRNVVCISHSQAKGMGFHPNCRVIHYGTDIDYFTPVFEKEDWFLFFSRIVHGKGVHIAVELAKLIGFKLKIVGEDQKYVDVTYVEHIKNTCKTLPNVEYVGTVSNEKALSYLQHAKALLFPQFWGEAFGLVMIEALACGTPVIAGGSNGAPPEVIENGKTGFLCNDFADYIQAIKNIDQIDTRVCREEVARRWSAKAMTKNYIKLYNEVIEGASW